MEPGQETQRTIEGLAEAYLSAMREVQPNGPYHLCGWSFGGVVAFEMARRLTRAGVLIAEILRLYGSNHDLGDLRSIGAAAARVKLAALLGCSTACWSSRQHEDR